MMSLLLSLSFIFIFYFSSLHSLVFLLFVEFLVLGCFLNLLFLGFNWFCCLMFLLTGVCVGAFGVSLLVCLSPLKGSSYLMSFKN